VITVVLADDQHLVRRALAALLNLEPDIEVVGEVGRGDELVEAVERLKPDVALVDIEMPGLDGLAATATLTSAAPPGPSAGPDHVRTTGLPSASDGGRSPGLRGEGHPGRPVGRCRPSGVPGERVVDPALAASTLAGGVSPLTGRERDVLVASRDGATVSDIAQRLFLSEGTVRNYLSSSIAKTGSRNRVEALRIAEQSGWL
jgi:two-component system, NarL family, response regulator DesR